MADAEPETGAEHAQALFDRYALPKVALTVILAASLIGAWVTTANVGAPTVVGFAKWLYFVLLGVLTGGLVWRHLFVRPADIGDGAAAYCAAMYDRFDRIAALSCLTVVALPGPWMLWHYLAAYDVSPLTVGYALLLATALGLTGATTLRSGDVEQRFRSPMGLAALAALLGLVVATAVAEVGLAGGVIVDAVVRVLHLGAFALWIGGAVWNIFVAVPVGQERPTTPVVEAAGEQLERFRWVVRFIIPTLLLTGLYQSVDLLGTEVAAYLGGAIGIAVLAKVGAIVGLFAIFKLCPMWRACSPIEGVCELEDLGDSDEVPRDAGGESACAGAGAEVTPDD